MPLTKRASAPPRRRIAALVAVEVETKVKFARLYRWRGSASSALFESISVE